MIVIFTLSNKLFSLYSDFSDMTDPDKDATIRARLKVWKIKSDFGDEFIITMAPIETSLEYNYSGIGGFRYKDLYEKMGNKIEYFNVQCYMDFSLESLEKMVNNKYPVEKIVMGSISCQDLDSNLNQLKMIKKKYPNFGGAYNWEYSNSPPDISHPGEWARKVKDTLEFI